MALSDHERTVLQEMELALRADNTRSAGRGRSVSRASRGHLAAAIGLVTAGVLVIALGLWLGDDLGTALGVLGFVLVVGSGWNAAHVLARLERLTATGKSTPASRPG
jgi:Flp pilus assembly protein TadB